MRFFLIGASLLASMAAFAAPDYAREKRWHDEVLPNIVVGDPVYLAQKNGHKFLGVYTESAKPGTAIVVVHGLGIHPDWGLIGTLRQRLPDLGYTTLSVQMPVLAANATGADYAATFPEAVERIALAVAFLKARKYQRIALVSHSLGSRMTHAYLAKHPAGISAWAALGLPDAALDFKGITIPVLDLYGEKDLPQVLEGAGLRRASLQGRARSMQIVISGANHFFADNEDNMVKAVKDFLDSVK